MTTDEGLARLAAAVRDARLDRYWSTEKAANAADLSRSTWEAVEKGRAAADGTYRKLERGLGWEPGQVKRLLSGEDTPPPTRGVDIPMEDPNLQAIVDAAQGLGEDERRQLATIAEALLRAARDRGVGTNGP